MKPKLITIRFEVRIYIHMSSVRLLIALIYTDIEEKTFSFLSALYIFIRSHVYRGMKALKVLLLFSTALVFHTRVKAKENRLLMGNTNAPLALFW